MSKELLFVGSYMEKVGSEGIYVFELDNQTGKLTKLTSTTNCMNPTYLVYKNNILYAANEMTDKSVISCYQYNPSQQVLHFINQIETAGKGLCYLSLWNQHPYLSGATYTTGHFVTCEINKDGSIGKVLDSKLNQGKGYMKGRQDSAHAHSLTPDCVDQYFVGADLGLDSLFIYRQNDGIFELIDIIKVEDGKGPRHFAFRKDGKFGYLITEMGNTIIVYSISRESGKFTKVEEVTTLPEDYQGQSDAAHIVISQDGSFLYASNRGHDSIACFKIDKVNGSLSFVDIYPSGGIGPRHFALSKNQDYVVVGHQRTHNLVVYKRDKKTGRMVEKTDEVMLFKPVCICFE